MKQPLIQTEQYLLLLGNPISGFENNLYVIKGERIFLWQNTMAMDNLNKPKVIMAHLPLVEGTPLLDGVMLLPEIGELKIYSGDDLRQAMITTIVFSNSIKCSDDIDEYIKTINRGKIPKFFTIKSLNDGKIFNKDRFVLIGEYE